MSISSLMHWHVHHRFIDGFVDGFVDRSVDRSGDINGSWVVDDGPLELLEASVAALPLEELLLEERFRIGEHSGQHHREQHEDYGQLHYVERRLNVLQKEIKLLLRI